MASNPDTLPFLNRLANDLLLGSQDETALVVLPNRRSLFVLKAYLGDADHVECYTIDELMEQLSGYQLIEPEELQVSFYQTYCKLEKDAQSFDQFTSWAVTFLSDLNDLDLHLGDVNQLYRHIHEYHATGASFEPLNAGPLEGAYLSFWQRLPSYYSALVDELDRLKLAYRGRMYRIVAEQIVFNEAQMQAIFSTKQVHWVGIIPGNPSERVLLDRVRSRQSLKLYADIDQYYLELPEHEAGRLFRNHPLKAALHWPVDLLRTHAKRIDIYPVAGQMAQIVQLRQAFDALTSEQYKQTVVVLADASMLSPFLEVFDDVKEELNITSGFPMRGTLVHRFVMGWLTLHSKKIERSGKYYFYHKHLENLFEYPVVQHWLSGALSWQILRKEIVDRNMKFIPSDWLQAKMQGDLFAQEAYTLLFEWPDAFDGIFDKVAQVLGQWKQQTEKLAISRIEAHAIKIYIDKLKQLLAQFGEVLPDHDLGKLKQFVHRQVGFTRLFIEEPKNDALQVMGMLESRMIDFKRVWFVGAADDYLPGSPFQSSHIPFMHRVHFKLPTRKDTEALMAYHFYRLLQRAEEVKLIYSTSASPLSSGEASRYLLQLKEELLMLNPSIQWHVHGSQTAVKASDQAPLTIHKSPAVINDIKAFLGRRVSPSAINKFINSPLEFYYYYVLGLKEQDEVEEDIELATLGTVVHKVLEDAYAPFKGKLLRPEALVAKIDEAIGTVDQAFLDHFDQVDLQSGRNLLMVEMAKHYVESFMRFEIEDLRSNGPVEILRLEERMHHTVTIQGVPVNLFGFADRIDRRGGHTRIIDYKTGAVNTKDLNYSVDRWSLDQGLSKAVQLALYKYMYCKIHDRVEENVGSYIVSFRNLDAGFQTLPKDKVNEDVIQLLNEVVGRMLDDLELLEHKEGSKYTTF